MTTPIYVSIIESLSAVRNDRVALLDLVEKTRSELMLIHDCLGYSRKSPADFEDFLKKCETIRISPANSLLQRKRSIVDTDDESTVSSLPGTPNKKHTRVDETTVEMNSREIKRVIQDIQKAKRDMDDVRIVENKPPIDQTKYAAFMTNADLLENIDFSLVSENKRVMDVDLQCDACHIIIEAGDPCIRSCQKHYTHVRCAAVYAAAVGDPCAASIHDKKCEFRKSLIK